MSDGLRAAYDTQLRTWTPARLPEGAWVEWDGPVQRTVGMGDGFVTCGSFEGLDGAAIDALIARQRDFFAARGEPVEWKTYGHDPADLPDRLRTAGFEPEEQETVVIGPAAPLAVPAELPDGVALREVTARVDLDRIARMEATVWDDEDRLRLAGALEKEIGADPDGTVIVVAETAPDAPVICAGWVRFVAGTGFATLWGGSTLPQWRGQGIYKALVRYRAGLAVARGYSFLQVDASDNSRPILQRLGFTAVTTTTPFVHTPR
jgi:GNAT superfamily N-acetyltransferase